jgi:hypothetical protein
MGITTVSIGHKIEMAIAFLDQNGQPMQTEPTPDAPPVWTNSAPTIDSLVVASNGMTAEDDAEAAGSDTVNLSLSVGGVAYSATLPVVVSPAPQVLTSIEIVPTVV